MKKKIVTALCLALSLSLLLCSCGGNNSQSGDDKTNVVSTPSVSEVESTIATVPTESTESIDTETTEPTEEPTEPETTEPTEEPTEPEATESTTQAPTKAPTTSATKAPATTQPHKHSYTAKVTKAATCTTEGTKIYTCSGCAHQYPEKIAKTAHKKDKGTVTKAATCTAEGTKTYKCSVCKTSMGTEKIAKTAHNWGGWECVEFANPKETGLDKRTCSSCKATDTRTVSKVTPDAGTTVFWWPEWSTGIQSGILTFNPYCMYWKDGYLYVDFYTTNRTGVSTTISGFEYLRLYDTKGNLIVNLQDFKFTTSVTLANGANDNTFRLKLGSDAVVYPISDLKTIDIADWKYA